MRVYLLLPFFLKICETLFHFNENGVDISYTVSSLSTCRLETDRFRIFIGISLQMCVTECGLRPSCISLTHRRNICNLFETADNVEYVSDGECTYILSSDITVNKKPCGDCDHGQVCDVHTKQCKYTECPVKTIRNGIVLGNVYVVGSKIRYMCNNGFRNTVNENDAVCQNNGLWSNDANCIRDCGNILQRTKDTASPNGTTNARVSGYELVSETYYWECAKANCEKLGGYLAVIKSQEEQEAIENLLSTSGMSDIWFGGRFDDKTKVFVWLDETKIQDGYENWDSGQPESIDIQPFLILRRNKTEGTYRWRNAPSNWKLPSICQFN